MATSAARKGAITVRRSGPSPKLVKAQERLKAIGKRSREAASNNAELIASVGAAAGLSYLQKTGKNLPTVAGVDPALLYGAALYLFGKKALKGKNGSMLEAAGNGLLAVAASNAVTRGGIKVAGDDDDRVSGDDDDD